MEKYDYLIIGGGIAGVTAAETIRERAPKSAVGIVSDEKHPLYSKVLLPSYLKKHISRDKLFLRKSEDFTRKEIDLRLEEKVAALNPSRKEVALSNGSFLTYEKLLIASGGRVKLWRGNTAEARPVYRLHTLEDADRLFEDLPKIKKPLVIGGSFIGLELLEIFTANNIIPSLLMREDCFFDGLMEETGTRILLDNLKRHDIETSVGEFMGIGAGQDGGFEALTNASKKISADALAVGIGIDRNVEFAGKSGLRLGERGILANEFLEASLPDIFAAGDAAEFYDPILKKHRAAGNWLNSFAQGALAGRNMTGPRKAFADIPSYSLSNFGFQITALGQCDKNMDNIARVLPYQHFYERVFLENGAIVGAIMLNMFKDKAPLLRLIKSGTSVAAYRDRLRDLNFDLNQIPVVK